ncbi:hypothetical protein ACVIIV_001892 [Bradyrhizobium sp. USDA 4354]
MNNLAEFDQVVLREGPNMNIPKPWSLDLSNPADAAPRGLPEFFECAVDGLTPKGSHQDDQEQCTCRDCAKAGVKELAFVYNKDVIRSKDAPRAADVLREIEDIRAAVEVLRNAISSVNDFTRLAFSDVGGFASLHEREAPDRSGPCKGLEFYDGSREWKQSLTLLERATYAASDRFLEVRGLPRGSIDKGGNTNLFKEYRTSAEYQLVVQGWSLFQRFRPNEAKGGEKSDFHNFLRDVYAYATRRDAEKYSGVTSWLHALARPLRKLDELVAERTQLFCELKSPLDPDDRKTLEKKLSMVVYRIAFLQQYILDLKLGKKPPRFKGGS